MSKDLDITNYNFKDLLRIFKLDRLQGCQDQTDKIYKKVEKSQKQEYQEFYRKAKKILNVLEKKFESEDSVETINDFIKKIIAINNFSFYSDNDLIDLIMQRSLQAYNENVGKFSLLNDPNYNVQKFTPGYNNKNNTNTINNGFVNSVVPGTLNPVKRITLTQNIYLNSCFICFLQKLKTCYHYV